MKNTGKGKRVVFLPSFLLSPHKARRTAGSTVSSQGKRGKPFGPPLWGEEKQHSWVGERAKSLPTPLGFLEARQGSPALAQLLNEHLSLYSAPGLWARGAPLKQHD